MVAGDRRLQPRASEKGGSQTGPSPVDRGRRGSKQHLLVDGGGIPLAWTLTGGNRNDVTQPLERGVKPVIAHRQTEHGSGLGRDRWVVERTFAWLHNRRRLLIRTDRRHDIHESFLALACCQITWRRLETSLS